MKTSERANAWKSIPVEKLDLPKRLIEALYEAGFQALADVTDWLNKDFREKKKGIGDKAVDDIRNALNTVIAPYHAPILQAELEQAKAVMKNLTQTANNT
jgi:DNA-directed RNA polymerase alpha subunit